MNIKEMTRPECVALLKSTRLGRLACVRDNRPYVVPIHFAFGDNAIFSFSLPGKKVEWMRKNPHVCLQVDDVAGDGWKSVVVDGLFEDLPKAPEVDNTIPAVDQPLPESKHDREFAWSLLQKHANWWEPGALNLGGATPAVSGSHLFYRIRIEAISGRQAFQ
ncbi:pyridoxamine 5'-phosphate oxidase family protein [Mesorhizobium waimense]|uniref:Pyridoxamine 5'-phosphate oxidase family protein n=1 Tax=Mesorhizobium waimense TaxID=1300307 RepID=A0A3A5K3E3_9HYPH|nr:pyridoxamine 5'-phosphate oxidase family protein [Mesorhizobium waimense]RJT29283.1 pyridoxamine 5'-phosphate oxidase family protein [Mesorhizobium waimense]